MPHRPAFVAGATGYTGQAVVARLRALDRPDAADRLAALLREMGREGAS